MRFYWNLNGDTITTDLDYLVHLSSQVMIKSGQTLPVELQFHRDRTPERLPVGAAILLGIKRPGQFDGAYLSDCPGWARPSVDGGFYTATLASNTAGIRDALHLDGGGETAALPDCLGEFQYLLPGATLPAKARTIFVTLDPHINQGDEATPTDADPPYPPGGELIRFLPAVSGYTGGGATKLDGIATVDQGLDAVAFQHVTEGLLTYRLTAGTDAESTPNVIRPDDYDAATNAFVWKLISRPTAPADSREPFIRFLPAISTYTGGGAGALDSVVTAGSTSLLAVAFRHASAGLLTYRLTAGTDAESVPNVIRPDDYHGTTNPYVWKLLTALPAVPEAPTDGFAYARKNSAWVRAIED